jgi:hypothetical protein
MMCRAPGKPGLQRLVAVQRYAGDFIAARPCSILPESELGCKLAASSLASVLGLACLASKRPHWPACPLRRDAVFFVLLPIGEHSIDRTQHQVAPSPIPSTTRFERERD